jgi:hypothetical protein
MLGRITPAGSVKMAREADRFRVHAGAVVVPLKYS